MRITRPPCTDNETPVYFKLILINDSFYSLQLVVYALRDRERKMKMERKTLSLQPPALLPSLSRRSPHPTGSPDRKRRVGIINESVASSSQHQEQQHSSQQPHGSNSNLSNPPLPKVKSTLESQVYLFSQIIDKKFTFD